MVTLSEVMGGYVIPALIVFVGNWLIPHLFPRWLAKVGVVVPVVAFVCGFWLLNGWPGWRPSDSTDWVMHAALSSMIVVFVSRPVWLRWMSLLMLGATFLWLLLGPIIKYDWTTTAAIVSIFVFTAAMGGQALLLDHLIQKVEPSRSLLLLMMIAGATTLTLGMSGSVVLAKTCGILATLLAAGWICSFWKSRSRLPLYWTPLFVIVTSGMWLSGYFYAELNTINALLLLAAVPVAWSGIWWRLETKGLWLRLMLHGLLPAIPLGIAFLRALLTFMSNESSAY